VDPDSRLTVSISDGRGRAVRAPGLAAWLRRVAPRQARGEIAIALVSDARIRALNRQYRRKDRPTDVLSFDPADLVISTHAARRQAREAGHSYGVELKILALHGLLHLLGYDHESPSDRGRMARTERRLRAKGGLREGLIERAKAPAARARRRSEARRSRAAERARAGGGAPASTQR
jgi:probable rRNA maturation factor